MGHSNQNQPTTFQSIVMLQNTLYLENFLRHWAICHIFHFHHINIYFCMRLGLNICDISLGNIMKWKPCLGTMISPMEVARVIENAKRRIACRIFILWVNIWWPHKVQVIHVCGKCIEQWSTLVVHTKKVLCDC